MAKEVHLRELFIEELAEVHGGGPVEDAIRNLRDGWNTTYACCEEGPDGCCPSPISLKD